MDITSSFFILLILPCILLFVSIFPGPIGMSLFLLLVSIVSYVFGAKLYIFILLGQIFLTYITAKLLENIKVKRVRQSLVGVYGVLLISILAFYKFVPAMAVMSSNPKFEVFQYIIFPLGLSYYTFKSISAVVDVYRGDVKRVTFLEIALYISYFPEIVSGPITLFKDFSKQVSQRSITSDNVIIGIKMILIGLFQKIVIADGLAMTVSAVFGKNITQIGSVSIWLATLYYSIQLLFDFSGYSHISIGVSRLFGFEMKENFNKPYQAISITDFWRRWHISLSTWFKEYLYIPLGGNRKGNIRTYVNLFIVFLATGIWHGSSLNFLIWGIYHGVFIVIERLFLSGTLKKIKYTWIPRLYTFTVVVIGWAMFRTNSLQAMLSILKRMILFNFNSSYFLMELFTKRSMFIFALGILLSFTNIWTYIQSKIKEKKYIEIVLYAILAFVVFITLVSDGNIPPIYSVF